MLDAVPPATNPWGGATSQLHSGKQKILHIHSRRELQTHLVTKLPHDCHTLSPAMNIWRILCYPGWGLGVSSRPMGHSILH